MPVRNTPIRSHKYTSYKLRVNIYKSTSTYRETYQQIQKKNIHKYVNTKIQTPHMFERSAPRIFVLWGPNSIFLIVKVDKYS